MNELYDQINLSNKDLTYHLVAFNGEDLGEVRFQKSLDLVDDGGLWKEVKAYVDGRTVIGYLDLSGLKQIYAHSEIGSGKPIENSRLINDLVIESLSISSEDKVFLSSLMHLGVDYNEYCRNPKEVIKNRFFSWTESQVRERMQSFDGCLKSASIEEQKILKKLFLDFILNNEDSTYFTRFWPKSLFNDKDIILALLNKDVLYISYASNDLKLDEEFILSWVKKKPEILEFEKSLVGNKEFMLKVASVDRSAFFYASDELKADEDFMLDVISKYPELFEVASSQLKSNKDFILKLVSVNSYVLTFIKRNKSLMYDKGFILEVISRDSNAIKYFSESFKFDKEFILEAISRNCLVIFYLSFDLYQDKDVKSAALTSLFSQLISNFSQKGDLAVDAGAGSDPGGRFQHIDIIKVNQLIEGYKKFKNNKFYHNQEGCSYIEAVINNRKSVGKLKKNLSDKIMSSKSIDKFIGDDRKEYLNEFITHLNLEGDCLKELDLKKPKALKILFLMCKQVVSYRNKEIKEFLIKTIQNYSRDSLERLLEISKENVDLILPSIILGTLDINKDKQKDLHDILKLKVKILNDKSNFYLQSIINLEKKLKNIFPKVSDEKIADVIKGVLNSSDLTETLIKLNLLVFILNVNPEKLSTIEDFSFSSLLDLVIKPLTQVGVLEDIVKDRIIFIDKFLGSRIPYAIFTYVDNFVNDKETLSIIKIFIDKVIKDTYLDYRHECNTHKHLLNDAQISIWEAGASQKLSYDGSEELLFDPLTFLTNKLITDHHGDGKLDRLIGSIQSGAAIGHPNAVEKLCIDLVTKTSFIEQLTILKELQIELENDEYKDIEFKRDVEVQIGLMESQSKKEFNLIIKDTEDWQDLFFCGTEVAGSCLRIEDRPSLNKCLLGYVLDGKVRMIKVSKKDEATMYRAILKIMKDPLGNPALLLERVYPDNDGYALAIKSFAKKRAQALGVSLYEPGGAVELHSEGNVAGIEYEDVNYSVYNKPYSINVGLVT